MRRISKKTAIIGLLFVGIICSMYVLKINPIAERQMNANDINKQTSGLTSEVVQGFGDSDKYLSRPVAAKSKASEDQKSVAVGGVYQGGPDVGALPTLTEKIIRTANLEVQIKKNKFEDMYDRAIGIVNRAGGYVSGSRSTVNDNKIAGGELTIRIPAGKFEDVLKSLRGLGKVKNLDISSEDVSSEYVDLQSRLRNWRAQEAVMLDLMRRAKTISESITIQNNLQQIQMEIEQISGRLQYINDKVGYSEIHLNINEPFAVPVQEKDTLGLKNAFKEALEASAAVLSSIIVIIGYALPLVIIGAILILIYRLASTYRPIKKRATPNP